MENLKGYDDSVCEFAQCTFNFLDRVVNFSWLFIRISCSLCETREITVFVMYCNNIRNSHFKNKNKTKVIIEKHFCLSIYRLYLVIGSRKFVITETGVYDIPYDENAMSSLIVQSIL